jgi:hypothetical protein
MTVQAKIVGVLFCLLLLAFAGIWLRNVVLTTSPSRGICKIALAMAFGGGAFASLFAMVAIVMGVVENRGLLTELIGYSILVFGSGIIIGLSAGCGSRRQ